MAKKSKKKALKLTKFIPIGLLGLAVLVIIMGFLPGVVYTPENGDPTSYSLFQVTFGAKLSEGGLGSLVSGSSVINFSFLALLAMLFPLIGAVVCLLVKGKLGGLIATICFLSASILFFFIPTVSSITSEVSSVIGNSSNTENFKDLGFALGVGPILAAIFSIFGTLGSACVVVTSK